MKKKLILISFTSLIVVGLCSCMKAYDEDAFIQNKMDEFYEASFSYNRKQLLSLLTIDNANAFSGFHFYYDVLDNYFNFCDPDFEYYETDNFYTQISLDFIPKDLSSKEKTIKCFEIHSVVKTKDNYYHFDLKWYTINDENKNLEGIYSIYVSKTITETQTTFKPDGVWEEGITVYNEPTTEEM